MTTTATIQASETLASFFSAVATLAEQRITEKKAAAEAKKQAALSIIGKATFFATGATLFGIEDRRHKEPEIYHLTFIAGRVRGCVNAATGEECSGRRWSGHCCHEDRVMAYEQARLADLPPAGPVVAAAEQAMDEATWDDRRKAFEAIKKEVKHIEMRHEMGLVAELLPEMAAGVQARVTDSIESGEGDWSDPFAGMSEQQQREAYRAMYPEDYSYYAA